MLRTISTHVFLRQRLHPGLLDTLAKGGAQGIEIFAARQHFDYTSKSHVKEIALWFAANPVQPFSMHMPLFGDLEMGPQRSARGKRGASGKVPADRRDGRD